MFQRQSVSVAEYANPSRHVPSASFSSLKLQPPPPVQSLLQANPLQVPAVWFTYWHTPPTLVPPTQAPSPSSSLPLVHSGPPGSGFLWTFWITGVSRNSNQMSPLPVVPGWVSMYSHLIARVSLVPAQVALEGSLIVPVCQIPFEVPLREAYPQPPRVPQFSWRMPSLLPSISSWKRHLITPPQSLSA